MTTTRALPPAPVFKEIRVQIDSQSWKAGTAPPTLNALAGLQRVNMLDVLNEIAVLTTPPIAYGFTTAETWAWRRYFPALDIATPLRLRQEWSDLDPHQKNILSDDLGMGFPIHLLRSALGLQVVTATHYFLRQVARRQTAVNAYLLRSGKRGPAKSPDFVAIDRNQSVHVIECKGSQSDRDTLSGLMRNGLPQKRNVVFPNATVGERLVAGLFIPQYHGGEDACVRICDPEPEDPIEINLRFEEILDIIIRGELASTLHAARLPTLANLIAEDERDAVSNNLAVRREIDALPRSRDDVSDRRGVRQEFSWTLEREDRRESHRLDLEVGIDADVLDAVLNPRQSLIELFYQGKRHREEQVEGELVSRSALGFYFRARFD